MLTGLVTVMIGIPLLATSLFLEVELWAGSAKNKLLFVALSTSEAENVALSSAAQEALWLKRLLIDLNVIHDCPIVIQEDNQEAMGAETRGGYIPPIIWLYPPNN